MFVPYSSRDQVQEETNVSLRESDVMLLRSLHFLFFFNLVAVKCKIVIKTMTMFSTLGLFVADLFIHSTRDQIQRVHRGETF